MPRRPPEFDNLKQLYPLAILVSSLSYNDRFAFHDQHFPSPSWYQLGKQEIVAIRDQQGPKTDSRHDVMADSRSGIGERRCPRRCDEDTHDHKGAGATIDDSRGGSAPRLEANAVGPLSPFGESEVEQSRGNKEAHDDDEGIGV